MQHDDTQVRNYSKLSKGDPFDINVGTDLNATVIKCLKSINTRPKLVHTPKTMRDGESIDQVLDMVQPPQE